MKFSTSAASLLLLLTSSAYASSPINFTSINSLQTGIQSNVSTESLNYTHARIRGLMCAILGFHITNGTGHRYSNSSGPITVLNSTSNSTGLAIGPDYRSPHYNGSAFYINVTSYFEDTLLWNNKTDSLLLNGTTVKPSNKKIIGQAIGQLGNGQVVGVPIPHWYGAVKASSPSGLAKLNGTLYADGALVLPQKVQQLLDMGKHFEGMAGAYLNSTGLRDGRNGTEAGNATIQGLINLSNDLTFLAHGLNSTVPIQNGTVPWNTLTMQCWAKSNSTLEKTKPKLHYLNRAPPGEVGIYHINRCDKPFHFAVESHMNPARNATRVGPNQAAWEKYHYSVMGGMSVKIADRPYQWLTGDMGIVQFEYDLQKNTDRMWMDLSFVDCGPHQRPGLEKEKHRDLASCPLREGGWLARWVTPENIWCPSTYCPAAEDPNEPCDEAYVEDKDDWATRACVWGQGGDKKIGMQLIACPNEDDLAADGRS